MASRNKSYIEGTWLKRKEEEDDIEIKRQVDQIKQSVFSKTRGSQVSRADAFSRNNPARRSQSGASEADNNPSRNGTIYLENIPE